VNIAELIQLERPLVAIDTETTGLSPKIDRIIQVAIIKIYPDGKTTEWETLINPGEPIPPESTKTHGITDEMVKDSPAFRNVAPLISLGMKDCDVIGYSGTFDLQMLKSEYQRLGQLTPEWGEFLLDPSKIFMKMEKRDLTAAVQFYCGETLEGAHNALVDIRATVKVLAAQLQRYPDLPRSVKGLHDWLFNEVAEGQLCPDKKFVTRNGVVILNFTAKTGTPLHQVDDGLLRWICAQEFVSKEAKEIAFNEQARRRQR
jgi:DNA polymerase-3 subunit epsilon